MKPWKRHLLTTTKTMLVLYAATFFLAYFFAQRGEHWLIPGIIIGILYAIVFILCVKHIIKTLPIAALMIAAPTLPLILLLMVVSLLPIVQWLQQ
jgi:hypothetical protein